MIRRIVIHCLDSDGDRGRLDALLPNEEQIFVDIPEDCLGDPDREAAYVAILRHEIERRGFAESDLLPLHDPGFGVSFVPPATKQGSDNGDWSS